MHARLAIEDWQTAPEVRAALASALDAAVRDTVSRIAALPGGLVPAHGEPDGRGVLDADDAVGDTASPEPDEPWSEAFDFGRLVPVVERELGGVVQPTVSARDVHTFLGVAKDYSDWWKAQVKRCSLSPDQFSEAFPIKGENPFGGRPRRESVVSLSAAKKVAMVSETRRGNAVRAYFIECERRLLSGELPVPGSGGAVSGVAPPVASARSSVPAVATPQPLDPLFMTLPVYLEARGLGSPPGMPVVGDAGAALVAAVLSSPSPGDVRLAGGVPCFAVAALDRWWSGARGALLLDAFARRC